MAKQVTATVTPRLRFPEFREATDWTTIELRRLGVVVTQRVGATECVPYTITTGVGLVSQQEKLGRTIAGNSLKNYVLLQRNDFAYNKSATKIFPQGFIARYFGDERAAVPNSIFTCFRTNDEAIDPAYLDGLFSTNLHGKWLRSRIAIGARAHGSLNVSDEDLMGLPVPLPGGPSSLAEQQKIANCLTSLDEVIVAQGRKVEALKAHKRGLMHQLFPRDGETRPRLRFLEFRDAPEWVPAILSDVCRPQQWQTISSSELTDDGYPVYGANGFIGRYPSFNHEFETVAVTCRGSTCGEVLLIPPKSYITGNSMCLDEIDSAKQSHHFIFHLLRHRGLRDVISGSAQPQIVGQAIRKLKFSLPRLPEQQRIADFLSSIDTQITAESNQLAALKTHKQGLMQQLFPAGKGS